MADEFVRGAYCNHLIGQVFLVERPVCPLGVAGEFVASVDGRLEEELVLSGDGDDHSAEREGLDESGHCPYLIRISLQ